MSEFPESAELMQLGYDALAVGNVAAASKSFGRALAVVERMPVRSMELVLEEAEALRGLRLATVHDDRVDQRALALRELGCWQEAVGEGDPSVGRGSEVAHDGL